VTEMAQESRTRQTSPLMELVGRTPLISLQQLTKGLPPSVHVLGKAEWYNPSGSVKDRPAASILREALRDGALQPEQILLDSTSGNMGIAYATFGASLGLRMNLVIPANASRERFQILQALGVELTISDPAEGSEGARQVASDMAASQPDRFSYLNQYDNPANWQAHFETTGPELLQQTQGRITHFVAGLGTSGTLVGVGRYFRQSAPGVACIAVQPDGPLHGLEGLKHLATSDVPGIYDPDIPARTMAIATETAYATARSLAKAEGLLVGPSAAAAIAAALELGRTLSQATIVALLPDSAWKYLDSPVWRAS
jgi:cysteine synthase B